MRSNLGAGRRPQRILVTGANGYIGKVFVKKALKCSHEVIAATRKIPNFPVSSWQPFAFTDSFILPSGLDVIIHLAANTTQTNDLDEEINCAKQLIHSAKACGARFIFVSSQTSRQNAPTAYGRIKWRIEQEVLSAGGWVVRPGQVYGGELSGLFGKLVAIVHRLPVLPLFLPQPQVQPIHVEDLAEGLLRLCEREDLPSGIYCLAAPVPVSFSNFLKAIAHTRLRCKRLWIPMPITLVDIIGKKFSRASFDMIRLRSLFSLPPMETQESLNVLGIKLRSLNCGMHPTGNERRRILLLEGKALLRFVLKKPPTGGLLRRYIRAIEQLRNGQSLGLQRIILAYPVFLSLFKLGDWSKLNLLKEYAWRLDAATLLAEATPLGAQRFLGLSHASGMAHSVFLILKTCTFEFFWQVLRIPLVLLLRVSPVSKKEAL